jgi:hypothetical protein
MSYRSRDICHMTCIEPPARALTIAVTMAIISGFSLLTSGVRSPDYNNNKLIPSTAVWAAEFGRFGRCFAQPCWQMKEQKPRMT